MDIQLLSTMVKELILDNDRVCLPGMGSFVADMVPASFSDRGYTVNPPYRRLSFRGGKAQEQDNLLVELYASANGVSEEIAVKAVTDFLSGLKEELMSRKAVVFPGLGRLRATRENVLFFVADEDLDIFPEGFALEPISLKSHSKPTSFDFSELDAAVGVTAAAEPEVTLPAEASVAVESLAEPDAAEAKEEPVAELDAAEAKEEPVAEPEEKKWWLGEAEDEEDEAEESRGLWHRGWFVTLFIVICLVALVALAFGAFMLLAKYCPDVTDRLLYTPEELDILNRKL